MSLLLDALRQAENNKSGVSTSETVAKDTELSPVETPVQEEGTAVEDADETLIELELLPDFDLTEANEPIEQSVDVQSSSVDGEPEADNALEFEPSQVINYAAQDVPAESTAPVEAVTPLPEISSQQDSKTDDQLQPARQAEEAEIPKEAEPPEHSAAIDDIDEVLAASRPAGGKRSFVLLLLLILLLGLLGGGFYLYQTTQSPPAAAFVPTEEPIDLFDPALVEESAVDNEPVPAKDDNERALVEGFLSVMGKAEAKIEPALPAVIPEQPKMSVTKETAAESSRFSVDYPDEIQIRIKKQPTAMSSRLQRAYDAFRGNRLDEAETLYRRVLQQDPSSIDALMGLGAIAERYGFSGRARHLFEKVLSYDGNHLYAQNALIRLRHSDIRSADESQYKTMLEKNPHSVQPHLALASLYVTQQRWKEAQALYFQIIELEPDNPDHHYNLAISLDHLGKSRAALDFYRQALQRSAVRSAGFDIATVEKRIRQLQGE